MHVIKLKQYMQYRLSIKHALIYLKYISSWLIFIDIYIFTFVKKMSTVKISNAAANGTLLISD